MAVKWKVAKYQNHSSVILIKSNYNENFEISKAKNEQKDNTLKELDPKKARGSDLISPKFVKLSADIIDLHSENINSELLKRISFRRCEKSFWRDHLFSKERGKLQTCKHTNIHFKIL